MRGGQATLVPNLECVAPNASGTLTAYFGYDNRNGVGIRIPFGAKNQLALDVEGRRNTLFNPGVHDFAFGVDFTPAQTLTYTLAPDNSPQTTLRATRSSPRCGPAQADPTECGDVCRAVLRSGCPGLTFQACETECLGNLQFTHDLFPQCLPQNQAWDACVARVPAGSANWVCSRVDFNPDAPACDAQLNDMLDCQSF